MNPEYALIHAACHRRDKQLIDSNMVQYFMTPLYKNMYKNIVDMTNADMKIDLDNCISVTQQTDNNPDAQKNEWRAVFNNENMPLPGVKATLKRYTLDTILSKVSEFCKSDVKHTEDEMKDYFKKVNERLSFYDIHNDVITAREAIQNIESSEIEVARRFEIKDANLKSIFGDCVYSKEYQFTGTAASGKTTFVNILANDLLCNGYNGLYLGYEDDKHFAASKIAAINTSIKKHDIIHREKYASDHLTWTGELYISDEPLTAKGMDHKIRAMLLKHKIDFIYFDFMQCVIPEKGQSETDAINDFVNYRHKIVQQFKIPFFTLSQVPANEQRDVMEGKKKLRASTEKGGNKAFNFSRYAYYFTPDGRERIGDRMCINVTIFVGKGEGNEGNEFTMTFDGESGRLMSIEKVIES